METVAPIEPMPATPRFGRCAAGLALGLAAALIWGSYLAMARAGVTVGLAATDIAFLRYGVAGMIMLPWLLRHQPATLAGIGWRRGAILALLAGPLFVLAGVSGYLFAPLAHGAVMQPTGLTLGVMAGAALLFGERLSRTRTLGMAIMIAGLAVIAGPNLSSGDATTPIGDLLFVSAGLMWAGFTLLSKRWGVNPVAATAAISVVSAVVYVPLYWALIGIDRLAATPLAVLGPQILVQGVLTGVVAVIAYAQAVQIVGPARAALFPAMVPAAAIVLGIPIAGEWPNLLQAVGLGVVTLGLLFALDVLSRRAPASYARPARETI